MNTLVQADTATLDSLPRQGQARGSHPHGGDRAPSVLFLAWPFPPLNAPASVRTWNIARGLARCGWLVNVVTPDPGLWRQGDDSARLVQQLDTLGIRAVYTDHRWASLASGYLRTRDSRLQRAWNGIVRRAAARFDVDFAYGWRGPVLAAMGRVPTFDVILATGSPFSAFALAQEISETSGKPYVLDYRDPWTSNPHVEGKDGRRTELRERAIAAGAAAITAVSPTLAAMLQSRFALGARVHVLTNGFDQEELAGVSPAQFDDFAIVYTGDLYPPLRVVDPVFAALGPLVGHPARPWTFHYYGAHGDRVAAAARRFGLESRVELHGRVPRRAALAAVKGAGLAVVVSSVGDGSLPLEKAMMTSKIFDSLGLRTPTLVIAPDGSDIAQVIERAGVAVRCQGCDIESINAQLARIIGGERVPVGDTSTFAWTNIAAGFDAVLKSAIEERTR
jgi:glycosyltransferase involved in cell wall biosynthesis